MADSGAASAPPGHLAAGITAEERVGFVDGAAVRGRVVGGKGRCSVGVDEGTAEGEAVAAGGRAGLVGVRVEERASGRGERFAGSDSAGVGRGGGLLAGGGARGTVRGLGS